MGQEADWSDAAKERPESREAGSGTESILPQNRGLEPSEPTENKFVVLSCSGCGHLLQQLQETNTVGSCQGWRRRRAETSLGLRPLGTGTPGGVLHPEAHQEAWGSFTKLPMLGLTPDRSGSRGSERLNACLRSHSKEMAEQRLLRNLARMFLLVRAGASEAGKCA